MGRILAIDYGTKRVGLAVTDPLEIIATPLDTVHSKDVINFLLKYIEREPVDTFVVGLPMTLSNQPTNATPLVKNFIHLLKKKIPSIPVVEIDERFTSKIALDTMIAGGMKKKDRRDKSNVDKISATLILQTYMQQKNKN